MYYFLSLFIVLGYTTYRSKNILYSNLKNYSMSYNDSMSYTNKLDFFKGFDLRYGLEEHSDSLITKIKNNYMKKNILEKLKNPHISTFEKIKIIDEFDILNNSMKIDVYKGGLTDDWEFTI